MFTSCSVLMNAARWVQVTIGEGSHPENVKVYGPGVEKAGLKANEPTYFTVDCSDAGQGGSSKSISSHSMLFVYYIYHEQPHPSILFLDNMFIHFFKQHSGFPLLSFLSMFDTLTLSHR